MRRLYWSSLVISCAAILLSLWALGRFCDGYSDSILNRRAGPESSESSARHADRICLEQLEGLYILGAFGFLSLMGAGLLRAKAARNGLLSSNVLGGAGVLIALYFLGTLIYLLYTFNKSSVIEDWTASPDEIPQQAHTADPAPPSNAPTRPKAVLPAAQPTPRNPPIQARSTQSATAYSPGDCGIHPALGNWRVDGIEKLPTLWPYKFLKLQPDCSTSLLGMPCTWTPVDEVTANIECRPKRGAEPEDLGEIVVFGDQVFFMHMTYSRYTAPESQPAPADLPDIPDEQTIERHLLESELKRGDKPLRLGDDFVIRSMNVKVQRTVGSGLLVIADLILEPHRDPSIPRDIELTALEFSAVISYRLAEEEWALQSVELSPPKPIKSDETKRLEKTVSLLKYLGLGLQEYARDTLRTKGDQSGTTRPEDILRQLSSRQDGYAPYEKVRQALHPSEDFFYMAEVPRTDAWGNPIEVWIESAKFPGYSMLIRSPGKNGVFEGGSYPLGTVAKDWYNTDLVWAKTRDKEPCPPNWSRCPGSGVLKAR